MVMADDILYNINIININIILQALLLSSRLQMAAFSSTSGHCSSDVIPFLGQYRSSLSLEIVCLVTTRLLGAVM